MNITTKEIIMYTRKFVVFSIVNIYRSACEHPFVVGMAFFLLLLYRFLPSLFGVLVSSSPIIICTALLLGMLLSFGQPNIPEIEEEDTTHDLSPSHVHAIANDVVVEKDESFYISSHIENRKRLEKTSAEEAKVIKQVDYVCESERGALSSASNVDEERKPEATVATSSLVEVDKKEIHVENLATAKEVNDRGHFKKGELDEAELLEDSKELAEHVHLATSSQNWTEGLQAEIHEPLVNTHFDSALDSSHKLIDSSDVSGSDSDHAESSSPDASMADIIPMLDELHPLLNLEDPQLVIAPVDDLHSLSGVSSEDGESDDGSGEEEAENQEEEGEEEEAKEENEDGAALAVKWTEDDEKNLIVLGTSELERNRRLENLIAKRRARKNLRLEAEKNLIDFDGNEMTPFMDELSRIPMQILPISTERRNPFDLPYDSEENSGLPPIPGSAPSILLPRRNPFDLPHDQTDESGNFTRVCEGHQGLFNVSQREMFFRRHESFALGASFTGEIKQEKHEMKLRPYFVAERTNLEAASYAHFQRQWSEKSDSKVSSVPDSESISSVAEQDHNCELSEKQLHQESEFELVSSSTSDANPVERENNSFDKVDSADPLSKHKEINICISDEVNVGSSEVCGASMDESVNDFIELVVQNGNDLYLRSPISDIAKSDVAEEKYKRSSSSYSSEMSEEILSTRANEGSIDLQQSSGSSSKDSSSSIQLVNREIEVVNDCHVVEPVYDSSPTAVEKSLSNIASLEEEFLHGSQGSFKSTSSLSSETLVETLEMGSPERNIFSEIGEFVSGTGSMGEISASDNGALWVAPSNLSAVEENESRSREVGEIREQDVIHVEFSEVNDAYDHPLASTLSESAFEQIMSSSSSTSTETDLSEDSTMDAGVDLQFSEHERIVVAPHPDVLSTSDRFNSEVSANAQPSLEGTIVQASFDTSLVDQQVGTFPSISKDVSEYFMHGEKSENESTSGTNDELIGSPKAVVPTANLPSVEHVLSVLHNKSLMVIDGNDDIKKAEGVPENGDSLLYLSGANIPDSSFDGIELPSQVEGMELLILSERTEVHESEFADTCSLESKEDALSKQENVLPAHVSGSDAVYASLEDLKGIDDEALLLELDAIGDFHVEELKLGESRTETHCQYGITDKQISEEPTFVNSEMGGSEVLLAKVHTELEENFRDLQEVEARSLEDIHMALKHVSEGTAGKHDSKAHTELAENFRDLQAVEARSLEDIHMALKHVSEGNAGKHDSEAHTELEDNFRDLQEVEARSLEEIHMALKHVSEGTAGKHFSETHTELEENFRDLQEIEARSLEDIHMALKHVSEGTAGNLPKPMEAECILDPREAEVRLFEGIHTQVSEGTPEESSRSPESNILHLQDGEPRPLEDIDMGSKHSSECSNDLLPELTDNKNDSSKVEATAVYIKGSPERMGTEDNSGLVEVEARSIADLDIALKHECEGPANGLPKLTDKKDGHTEVEVTERNLEPCILVVPTSEKIELARAVTAGESDQGEVPGGVKETPCSSSSSSASKSSRKKEKSHQSDSSSSSSSSDSD